jgi:hypothetical protein
MKGGNGMDYKALTQKQKRDFARRLDNAMALVPVTDEEADEILALHNIDVDTVFTKVMRTVAAFEAEQARKQRVAAREKAAMREHDAFVRKEGWIRRRQTELVQLGHAALVAIYQTMSSQGGLQVAHRKLQEMTTEDLALLIAECEADDGADDEK